VKEEKCKRKKKKGNKSQSNHQLGLNDHYIHSTLSIHSFNHFCLTRPHIQSQDEADTKASPRCCNSRHKNILPIYRFFETESPGSTSLLPPLLPGFFFEQRPVLEYHGRGRTLLSLGISQDLRLIDSVSSFIDDLVSAQSA
jgi:hypothetical protein